MGGSLAAMAWHERMLSAACFKTSTSIRGLRFSRSSSAAKLGRAVATRRGEPVAFIDCSRGVPTTRPTCLGLPALREVDYLPLELVGAVGCLGSLIYGPPVSCAPPGTVHISVAKQSPRKRFDPKPLRRTSGPFSASAQGATRVRRLSVRRRSLSRSNGLPSERSPRADIKLQRRASERHAEVAADGLI